MINLWCKYFLIGLVFVCASEVASAGTKTMGNRSNEHLPLITNALYNSDLYQCLYALVTENIGCKQGVIRESRDRYNKPNLSLFRTKVSMINIK